MSSYLNPGFQRCIQYAQYTGNIEPLITFTAVKPTSIYRISSFYHRSRASRVSSALLICEFESLRWLAYRSNSVFCLACLCTVRRQASHSCSGVSIEHGTRGYEYGENPHDHEVYTIVWSLTDEQFTFTTDRIIVDLDICTYTIQESTSLNLLCVCFWTLINDALMKGISIQL